MKTGSGIFKNIPPQVVIYLVLAIAFLFLVYQVAKKVGLVRTREDKRVDKERAEIKTEELRAFAILSELDGFRPDYYQKVPSANLLLQHEAESVAEQIKDAFYHWWAGGDDEAQVYGALRRLANLAQLSQVAEAYLRKYQEDLLGKLREKFDNSEMLTVKNIVKALPDR